MITLLSMDYLEVNIAGRRSGFKDDAVRTGSVEWAAARLPALRDAHQPAEGRPQCASQRVPLVEGMETTDINFSADRNHLFSAWNAIAILAYMAGKVTVTVHADPAEGFDKGKLQNGVLEPRRESDLIK